MRKSFIVFLIAAVLFPGHTSGQDLDSLLAGISGDNNTSYTYGTFKGTRIINGQSAEVTGRKDMNFIISHRFGAINLGIYEFFGMDQASTRLGLEYGITDNMGISVGRNTWQKIYDGAVKYRLLRQQTGERNIPFTLTLYSAAFAKSLRWEDPERDNLFSSRMTYTSQVLIARKFSKKLSLQISPSYVHKNLVPTPEDQNNIFAIGFGGRYKITRKLALNADYYYLLPGKTADDFYNSLAIGLDIETGGHVFQLHCTNSQTMFESGFISETTGGWLDGEIFFGFNICRVFSTSGKQKNIY